MLPEAQKQLQKLTAERETARAKLAEIEVATPETLATFEAADADLVVMLGREKLGEATEKEVAQVREEAQKAADALRANRSAEVLLKDRIADLGKQVASANSAVLQASGEIAKKKLPSAVKRVQALAAELADAITLAARLDCAVRRDTGMMSGRALDQAIGGPVLILRSKNIEPYSSEDGGRGFRFVREPAPFTPVELSE